jgi:hypothetical protein
MAEREGFEPSLGFHLNQISNLAPSTTRPSLRVGITEIVITKNSRRWSQWLMNSIDACEKKL